MAAAPVLPKNAPFSAADVDILNGVVGRSTPLQRSWLSGFLAGLDASQAPASVPAQAQRPRRPLTILYATESGNSEALAHKARKLAQKQNFDARVLDMADADIETFAKSKNLLIFVATWGEGDPPQRAADFYAALMSENAPRLDGVRFAVLALGDTAYAQFCAVGRAMDERLQVLGGIRMHERQDLDLDFAKPAAAWTEKALSALAPIEVEAESTVVHVDFKGAPTSEEPDEPVYTSENPAEAEISDIVNLNGTGSTRETWHVELRTDAPGFTYQAGDAIGVIPENDPELVGAILDATGLAGNVDLADALRTKYDITTLSRPLVDAYAKLTGRYDISMISVAESFPAFAKDRQLIDLFEAFPEKLTAEQLTGLLRPLPGRLYSVASSFMAHPDEAHLLVGAVRWASHNRKRNGVASTFLGDRRKAGDTVKIYVRPNRHFRLPKDGSRPIIMIGAGTGVAPYRGFVEQRAELGVDGRSWLFFGERNYTNDFLYQTEWQEHLASGALSRIDVAFSRDQPEKIYVQDRLWERREELRQWIDDGAHLYVCGDEKGMAKDVDNMLVKILAEPLKDDKEAGRAKLKELSKASRYQRDVY